MVRLFYRDMPIEMLRQLYENHKESANLAAKKRSPRTRTLEREATIILKWIEKRS